MELTEGSETSANHNLTPGKYPKEYIQYSKHGERLKSSYIWPFIEAELNPICHLPALLGTRHILHVGRIRVNSENRHLQFKTSSEGVFKEWRPYDGSHQAEICRLQKSLYEGCVWLYVYWTVHNYVCLVTKTSSQKRIWVLEEVTSSVGSTVGWGTDLLAGRSLVRFPMVSLEFFISIILPAAL
jgi:hypothetical protein